MPYSLHLSASCNLSSNTQERSKSISSKFSKSILITYVNISELNEALIVGVYLKQQPLSMPFQFAFAFFYIWGILCRELVLSLLYCKSSFCIFILDADTWILISNTFQNSYQVTFQYLNNISKSFLQIFVHLNEALNHKRRFLMTLPQGFL